MGICKFVLLKILEQFFVCCCQTDNYFRSFGETQDIVSKAGKELTKREIVLVDQSAAEVSILSSNANSMDYYFLSNSTI